MEEKKGTSTFKIIVTILIIAVIVYLLFLSPKKEIENRSALKNDNAPTINPNDFQTIGGKQETNNEPKSNDNISIALFSKDVRGNTDPRKIYPKSIIDDIVEYMTKNEHLGNEIIIIDAKTTDERDVAKIEKSDPPKPYAVIKYDDNNTPQLKGIVSI